METLQVASAIIELTVLGARVLFKARNIYTSTTCVPAEVETLSGISWELISLSKKLKSSELSSFGLEGITHRCESVTEQLLSIIRDITVKGEKTAWKSLVAAIRHLIKDKRIEHIKRDIGELQVQLGLHLHNILL